jgi:hypothetical protein
MEVVNGQAKEVPRLRLVMQPWVFGGGGEDVAQRPSSMPVIWTVGEV